MKKLLFTLISFFLISWQFVYSEDFGEYKHDGFFMRFLLGGSSSKMTFKVKSNDMQLGDMEFSGLSIAFRFQIGGEIAENLNAFGEVGAITIDNPKVKVAGKSYDTEETLASNSDFGAGLTYYFMPINIYVSGSILASKAQLEYKEGSKTTKGESDMGLGLFLTTGKEWWIDIDWALGASIYAAYSNVPDKGDDKVTIKTTTFGIAFSATFQ